MEYNGIRGQSSKRLRPSFMINPVEGGNYAVRITHEQMNMTIDDLQSRFEYLVSSKNNILMQARRLQEDLEDIQAELVELSKVLDRTTDPLEFLQLIKS